MRPWLSLAVLHCDGVRGLFACLPAHYHGWDRNGKKEGREKDVHISHFFVHANRACCSMLTWIHLSMIPRYFIQFHPISAVPK
ncbi:hypothetical protein F4859DRAFT_450431 [Xylaria cf. heliscus]|nr:hypothetical protein F4859DRAFT_450431 [Xylaria cf. heliscus]